MNYLGRSRGTATYIVFLLAVSVVAELAPAAGDRVLRAVSTNLANVDWSFPLRLLGSALVVDLSGDILTTVLIVGVGIVGCLGWLERRFGTARAFGIFLAVHVVATLVTLAVIVVAIPAGYYPDEVRDVLDYGVSYGAIGCVGAVTMFLPRWARLPWIAVALLFPLTAATWYGWLPDYAAVGHLFSALAGFAVSAKLVRTRVPAHR